MAAPSFVVISIYGGVSLGCCINIQYVGEVMAAIEYYERIEAGTEFTLENPIVKVMGRMGQLIPVPCVGVADSSIIKDDNGHKVKIIAERYTNDRANKYAKWISLRDDEAVLGFRTNKCFHAPNQWVVYLVCDKSGKLIIIPRSSKPLVAKTAMG